MRKLIYEYLTMCMYGRVLKNTMGNIKLWIKGAGRLCKVVKLSMQCCGQILQDSFETYMISMKNNNNYYCLKGRKCLTTYYVTARKCIVVMSLPANACCYVTTCKCIVVMSLYRKCIVVMSLYRKCIVVMALPANAQLLWQYPQMHSCYVTTRKCLVVALPANAQLLCQYPQMHSCYVTTRKCIKKTFKG